MHVVIAGSSGLIGTALIPLLRQSGHEVTRLVRRSPGAPDERRWDPPSGLLELDFTGVDAIVNLCGADLGGRRWSDERKQTLRDSRATPTEVLANAAAEHAVPVMLNASAVGYYGHTGDEVVDETSPPGSDFLSDLCRQWEHATSSASESGVRVVRARTGLVLAGSGGLLGKLKPLFSFLLGGRLGDGTQYMPWISLDDEIAAMRFALEHSEVSGPVNLCGPTPVTNAEFTGALANALRRPAPWVVPGFALRAVLGELADTALLSGQRAVPTVLQRNGFVFQHPSVGAALAAAFGSSDG